MSTDGTPDAPPSEPDSENRGDGHPPASSFPSDTRLPRHEPRNPNQQPDTGAPDTGNPKNTRDGATKPAYTSAATRLLARLSIQPPRGDVHDNSNTEPRGTGTDAQEPPGGRGQLSETNGTNEQRDGWKPPPDGKPATVSTDGNGPNEGESTLPSEEDREWSLEGLGDDRDYPETPRATNVRERTSPVHTRLPEGVDPKMVELANDASTEEIDTLSRELASRAGEEELTPQQQRGYFTLQLINAGRRRGEISSDLQKGQLTEPEAIIASANLTRIDRHELNMQNGLLALGFRPKLRIEEYGEPDTFSNPPFGIDPALLTASPAGGIENRIIEIGRTLRNNQGMSPRDELTLRREMGHLELVDNFRHGKQLAERYEDNKNSEFAVAHLGPEISQNRQSRDKTLISLGEIERSLGDLDIEDQASQILGEYSNATPEAIATLLRRDAGVPSGREIEFLERLEKRGEVARDGENWRVIPPNERSDGFLGESPTTPDGSRQADSSPATASGDTTDSPAARPGDGGSELPGGPNDDLAARADREPRWVTLNSWGMSERVWRDDNDKTVRVDIRYHGNGDESNIYFHGDRISVFMARSQQGNPVHSQGTPEAFHVGLRALRKDIVVHGSGATADAMTNFANGLAGRDNQILWHRPDGLSEPPSVLSPPESGRPYALSGTSTPGARRVMDFVTSPHSAASPDAGTPGTASRGRLNQEGPPGIPTSSGGATREATQNRPPGDIGGQTPPNDESFDAFGTRTSWEESPYRDLNPGDGTTYTQRQREGRTFNSRLGANPGDSGSPPRVASTREEVRAVLADVARRVSGVQLPTDTPSPGTAPRAAGSTDGNTSRPAASQSAEQRVIRIEKNSTPQEIADAVTAYGERFTIPLQRSVFHHVISAFLLNPQSPLATDKIAQYFWERDPDLKKAAKELGLTSRFGVDSVRVLPERLNGIVNQLYLGTGEDVKPVRDMLPPYLYNEIFGPPAPTRPAR